MKQDGLYEHAWPPGGAQRPLPEQVGPVQSPLPAPLHLLSARLGWALVVGVVIASLSRAPTACQAGCYAFYMQCRAITPQPCSHLHLSEKETDVQRAEVTGPRWHN